ncbi:MAG: adenylate cyclase, partial [Alphaproteobacteria bacterium]|nr:adenylate cyclase [Alphaproteobacteria bacterium]
MDDFARWLEGLGLGKYAEAFAAAEVDASQLADLTDADLRELGLPLGPRKKLLQAIAALGDAVPPDGKAPAAAAAPGAERRQITVLFADLAGSTAMAQGADPEDFARILRSVQDAAAGAVTRFEGHVAKFMGDGLLAYFGWPRAHEDDAERAVRAALAMIEAVRGLKGALQLRIGIATGLVVVGEILGEGAAREETAVGETLNLAARLQAEAVPGSILVAPSTRPLLAAVFDLEALEPRALKGIAEKVTPYRVVGERSSDSRFESARGQRLNALVGRDQELALALARFELARAGEGQVVLLRAEPGIGKSRLVAELRARLEPQVAASLRYQCSPHHA